MVAGLDAGGESRLRFVKAVKDVEYHRDIKPILQRSCVACHSQILDQPAGKLVLDDDKLVAAPRWDLGNAGPEPATYNTLAGNSIAVTRYGRGFQSRRSPLVWKLFGRRLDGLPKEPLKGKDGQHKLELGAPICDLKRGMLTVAVKDRQGNVTRIERTFSVRASRRLCLAVSVSDGSRYRR